jgi:hypothetical protein
MIGSGRTGVASRTARDQDEVPGGTAGITELTSTDHSVTITNPTGPVADLSVPPAGPATVAAVYADGASAADQTAVLKTAKGGGLVIDGTDAGFNGATNALHLKGNTALGALAPIRVTGAGVNGEGLRLEAGAQKISVPDNTAVLDGATGGVLQSAGVVAVQWAPAGDVALGGQAAQLATGAVAGFASLPSMHGAPTGVPTVSWIAGAPNQAPQVYDDVNKGWWTWDLLTTAWRFAGTGGSGVLLSSATLAALATLPAAPLGQGSIALVTSNLSPFILVPSTAAARAGVRIAASGKAGFQWVRVVHRNPVWEVQATWIVDPTNSTGFASDDNTGLTSVSGGPLLTWTECALRLATAEINQATTITVLGDQQAGDNPTFTYVARGLNFVNFVGVPSELFSSTVTGYTAAAFNATAADDCQLADTAVPGGSFTAAGALATGLFVTRTNGTVIYAPVLKDLGGTTCRVGQPINPASVSTNIGFAVADAYRVIKTPVVSSLVLPMDGNSATTMKLFDWKVPANSQPGCPGVQLIVCYIEKLLRSVGLNCTLQGCCIDLGAAGGSFEGGGPVSTAIQVCAFKGTGATRYSFSGSVNSEGNTTTLQGCQLLVENGFWNMGQLNVYDTAGLGGAVPGAFTTGTAGRAHFIGTISGKGNTGKLVAAVQSSQVVAAPAVVAGTFYTAASTTDGTPIQSGGTTSAGQILLDANMNGVFQTG